MFTYPGILEILLATLFVSCLCDVDKPDHKTVTFGTDCNVMSAKIDNEISFTILYNGSAVNSSCDEMSFISNDDHEICVKSSKFHDPDCAVELLIQRGEDEKESKFNCQATETFCSKSKGSLSIQYILRNNSSPQNVSFSIVVFADEFDWDLLRTVLSIAIPLFLFLVTGIFLAFCFFCNRRRRTRAPYNTRPPVGSYPTQSSSYNNPPTGADSTLPPQYAQHNQFSGISATQNPSYDPSFGAYSKN